MSPFFVRRDAADQTASPSAAGASSEKKCRLTIGCGLSALRWTTARAEFAPVCRESLGIGAALDDGRGVASALCWMFEGM